jgi:hypothetical protein
LFSFFFFFFNKVTKESMIGAFEFGLDDYVGRCMILGFIFSNHRNFPPLIEKVYDPDGEEMTVGDFHEALKKLDQEGEGVKYFAYYRNDITDQDNQYDGVPKAITLTLRMTCEVHFAKESFRPFLANGMLEDDPPVLEMRFSNPHWLTQKRCWGFPMTLPDPSDFTPEEGGILVEERVQLSFYNDESFFSPRFSGFAYE